MLQTATCSRSNSFRIDSAFRKIGSIDVSVAVRVIHCQCIGWATRYALIPRKLKITLLAILVGPMVMFPWSANPGKGYDECFPGDTFNQEVNLASKGARPNSGEAGIGSISRMARESGNRSLWGIASTFRLGVLLQENSTRTFAK